MSAIKVTRGTTTSRLFAVVALIGVATLAAMPSWGEPSTQRKMVELFTLLALAEMWNLLAGFAGVVSVGQQAFMGLGAYAMIALVNVNGHDLYRSVPVAALHRRGPRRPDGARCVPLRGSYFAYRHLGARRDRQQVDHHPQEPRCRRWSVTEGQRLQRRLASGRVRTGLPWSPVSGRSCSRTSCCVQRLGLQMQAIRDDEGGARGLGVNVYRTRFVIWIVAAFWTGLAAGPYYMQQLRVQPVGTGGAFSVVLWTAPIIFIVVIGGIGTIEGPIIGAVLYYFLRDRFQDHQTVYLISMGLVAMGVALWLQGGIWGTIRRRFGVDLFPVRRRLADRGAEDSEPLVAVDPV